MVTEQPRGEPHHVVAPAEDGQVFPQEDEFVHLNQPGANPRVLLTLSGASGSLLVELYHIAARVSGVEPKPDELVLSFNPHYERLFRSNLLENTEARRTAATDWARQQVAAVCEAVLVHEIADRVHLGKNRRLKDIEQSVKEAERELGSVNAASFPKWLKNQQSTVKGLRTDHDAAVERFSNETITVALSTFFHSAPRNGNLLSERSVAALLLAPSKRSNDTAWAFETEMQIFDAGQLAAAFEQTKDRVTKAASNVRADVSADLDRPWTQARHITSPRDLVTAAIPRFED